MQSDVFLTLSMQSRTSQPRGSADAAPPDAADFAHAFHTLGPSGDEISPQGTEPTENGDGPARAVSEAEPEADDLEDAGDTADDLPAPDRSEAKDQADWAPGDAVAAVEPRAVEASVNSPRISAERSDAVQAKAVADGNEGPETNKLKHNAAPVARAIRRNDFAEIAWAQMTARTDSAQYSPAQFLAGPIQQSSGRNIDSRLTVDVSHKEAAGAVRFAAQRIAASRPQPNVPSGQWVRTQLEAPERMPGETPTAPRTDMTQDLRRGVASDWRAASTSGSISARADASPITGKTGLAAKTAIETPDSRHQTAGVLAAAVGKASEPTSLANAGASTDRIEGLGTPQRRVVPTPDAGTLPASGQTQQRERESPMSTRSGTLAAREEPEAIWPTNQRTGQETRAQTVQAPLRKDAAPQESIAAAFAPEISRARPRASPDVLLPRAGTLLSGSGTEMSDSSRIGRTVSKAPANGGVSWAPVPAAAHTLPRREEGDFARREPVDMPAVVTPAEAQPAHPVSKTIVADAAARTVTPSFSPGETVALAAPDQPSSGVREPATPVSAAPLPPAAQQVALARDVAQQLSIAVRTGPAEVTELTLRPEELGQVRMRFTGSDGQIVLQILSERPETQDLMRRHIEVVERAFRELGYSDIAFDFGSAGQRDPSGQAAVGDADSAADGPISETPAQQTPARSATLVAGRLDIRL